MEGDEELVFDFSCDYFCEGEEVLFCKCGLQMRKFRLRTWPKKQRIQWGQWDCKSNEMTAGIVCHVESLQLNHEAIVWKIMLPFGRRLSLHATRLAAVFSMNFPSYLRASKSLVLHCENRLHLLR